MKRIGEYKEFKLYTHNGRYKANRGCKALDAEGFTEIRQEIDNWWDEDK